MAPPEQHTTYQTIPSRLQTKLVAVTLVILVGAAAIHGRLGDEPDDGVTGGPAASRNKTHTHIYFLLDRSGSMESIASDVLGGFNAFVRDQTRDAAETTLPTFLSLIQFDDRDPFECVLTREAITDVQELTRDTFQPRGLTPLLDAIGNVIEHASKDEGGGEADKGAENTVVVVFSDGQENASRKHTRAAVFDLVKEREAAGWTFVFLGANQDSYVEAGGYGVSRGSTQNFKFDSGGVKSAFHSLSRASSSMNKKLYREHMAPSHAPTADGVLLGDVPVMEQYKPDEFFEGIKEAEADIAARGK